MHEYADGWQYEVRQIGEHTEAAVRALDQIGQAFDECDAALAQACRPAGEGNR